MDGFTFLRILMSKQPTPVIVVSSYAQKENVFKALELGALDFVTKPDQKIAPDARELREQLLSKVLALRTIKPKLIQLPPTRRMPSGIFSDGDIPSSDGRPQLKWSGDYAPRWIVAIACSTGGPGALIDIFGRILKPIPAAFVVAQHMPDKFTRTFAERLAKRGPIRFSEAQDGDRLFAKTGLVCPGRQCMEVVVNETSFYAKLAPPSSGDRYVPSGETAFCARRAIAGPRCIGIVLTGMGDDGIEGARAIRAHGPGWSSPSRRRRRSSTACRARSCARASGARSSRCSRSPNSSRHCLDGTSSRAHAEESRAQVGRASRSR